MSRKDFVLIAGVLREQMPDPVTHPTSFAEWNVICRAMASALRTTNAYFDRERFLNACGVND